MARSRVGSRNNRYCLPNVRDPPKPATFTTDNRAVECAGLSPAFSSVGYTWVGVRVFFCYMRQHVSPRSAIKPTSATPHDLTLRLLPLSCDALGYAARLAVPPAAVSCGQSAHGYILAPL